MKNLKGDKKATKLNFSKDINKNHLFTYKSSKELDKEDDDSISKSSENIDDKLNRLINLKKNEKKNKAINLSPSQNNKIESSIITSLPKPPDNNNNSNIINIISKTSKEEKKININTDTKKVYNKKNIKSKTEKFIISLFLLINKIILSPKKIFLKNIKKNSSNHDTNTIRNNNIKRTTKKRITQKMIKKKGTTMRDTLKKEEEKMEEIEEYAFDEDELNDEDTFIKLNKDTDDSEIKVNRNQLNEYDLFYKEQFFRNELFRYDAENIKDKEEEDINKQMNKLECKRRLMEKKKLKEVNDLKGLDTTELNREIKKLTKKYEKIIKVEEPKIELELNNTEKLLQKGRILGFYFDQKQKREFPHFSMYDSKEKGAEEIIDFKVLRKEEQARRFFDYYCCMEQRKKINTFMVNLRYWCRLFVANPIFDYFSLFVIILNTVLILISDPTDPNNIGNLSDNYFLYFYTLESILKIIAFRFWSSDEAYIKDAWNILDFSVVIVGWILFIIEQALNGTKISGLAGLRAFRILRPLKTVKRFKGLKKLVTALLLALSHLGETGTVLFFFFMIFAIAGRLMWQGLFYRRCTNLNYGYFYSTYKYNYMCTFDTDCQDLNSYGVKNICSKGYLNPDSGAFNFDNVLTGFVTVFAMATLEGWTDIFTYVSKTFKDKIYINPIIVFCYFHFFIFLSSFYMLKLFLAITNAEYEHIEVSRRELTEKKEFFKLIQSKYDIKMKEKAEKKEKERQLKESNLKKSDEALLDLYYKVGEEAFQINKNKRNIPILYSTVKDIYIMSNNNPEEIYLQNKRIEEEETFLSKDIKRLHKEIDVMIKEKRKEMKESSNLNKNNEEEDNKDNKEKNKNDKNDNNNKLNNKEKKEKQNNINNQNKNVKKKKNDKIKLAKQKTNPKTSLDEIKKRIKEIKEEIIEITIDNTQKYIKEKAFELSRKMTRIIENKNEEKNDKNNDKNKKKNQSAIEFEDLPYEKIIKEKKEGEKNKKEQMEKNNKTIQKSLMISKRISKTIKRKEDKKKIDNELNKSNLSNMISFVDELNLSKNEEKKELLFRKRNSINNNINKYLFDFDNDPRNQKNDIIVNNINDISLEENKDQNDILNKSLISKSSEENKAAYLPKIKTINLDDKDELFSEVNFNKPKSILAPVINLIHNREIQEKMQKIRENFNLNRFLEKEKDQGTNVDYLGRRKSYLDFLQYTEKKIDYKNYIEQELENKNIKSDKKNKKKEKNYEININIDDSFNINNNNISNNNISMLEKKSRLEEMIEDKYQDNVSFLSYDSNLTIDKDNISLDDINLLPKEMKEMKILVNSATTKESIKKNVRLNQLTKLLRSSNFDKNAVNTNINLTSYEQSKYYKNINKKLNRNLTVDLCNPRNRKNTNVNISTIKADRDYDEFLENIINNEDDESINNNNNNNINNNSINDEIKNNNDINLESERNLLDNNTKNEIKENIKKLNNMNIEQLNNKHNNSNSKRNYGFKAKSIEKNLIKYPVENSNDFLVKEENRPYSDPLTLKQEGISDNLRGKKFYMNYLYNIIDKDLKVKDNFKVGHWSKEIFGKKEKFFKMKKLPEIIEPLFVFNDKKLNLKKYIYMYHKDKIISEKDFSIMTHNLKFLPNNVLQLMPLRLRNFGKYFAGKEINLGTLGIKVNSSSLMNFSKKFQSANINSRSGKNATNVLKNKSNLILSSSFMNNNRAQEEIKSNKGLYEKIYKNIDTLNYRTLQHFFLNEEKLIHKFYDERKMEEEISEIREHNKNKQNRIEVKNEINSILIFDTQTNSKRYVQWSGADVLMHLEEDDHRKRWNEMIEALEKFNIIIWHKNPIIKNFQKARYAFYLLATNDYFDYFILTVVVVNSVFMAIDGNILKPEHLDSLNVSNYLFNSIYIFEYVIKFIGLGPIVYYSDPFTYLDTFIIIFSIIDMATPSTTDTDSTVGAKKQNVSSQLGFLRVFRIFRVVRLTKVLRRIKAMRLIIVSITKAIINVSYIIAIIIMFILIFQLLGMSLLSGNSHYQSFLDALYTTYQILTLESWNELLVELWPMNYFCFFYFLVWIILGNFVLFNLFISILLQSFGEGDKEDEDDLTDDEKLEKMFTLPDYLYSIKESVKFKKTPEKLQKRSHTFEAETAQNNIESASKSQIEQSKSQNLATSISNKSMINLTQSTINESMDDDDDEEEDEKSEDDDDYRYRVYTNVEKNMRDWQKINKIFRKTECENSIYIFSQTNKFRIFCMKLITNKWFDRFILLIILLSTLRLIVDTFLKGYTFVLIFDIIDAIFNIIFLLEAIFKIIAMGVAVDEGSYLRDNWNKIDIIIVICSVFDFQNLFTKYLGDGASSSSLKFLKVLRLLRTLRPLRFISHNLQLKLLLTSLFESILPIITALCIVIIVFYVFSIVGINIFYNSFHNCYAMKADGSFILATDGFEDSLVDASINNDMPSISNHCSDKYNGIMDTGPAFLYSNIATSIITSYILATQEAWPEIMDSYRIYSNSNGLFFIVYNLFVSYFVLNLFTGIMFRYFNEAYKRETKLAEGDKKAPKYYDFLNQITSAESHYVIWVRPVKGTWRYYIREFCDSSFLDNFIMVIIILNMLTMALVFENCPPVYEEMLTIINYIFTGIFIAECLVKLVGLGPVAYFHTGWNKFDFFVVVASILDIIIANIDGIDAAFLKSFQIIRVLRVLRITRALRLVKSLKGLEKLIQTLSWSISALMNVILLMILIYSIFAILGVYFYDGIDYEKYKSKFKVINEYYNLDNFYTAFLFTFRSATGEKWPYMMMELAFVDTVEVYEAYAYIYMIISNFFDGIIMINLFLMVTIQQYDEFTGKKYNPIEKFESFLSDFNNAWNKYTTYEDNGFRIKKNLVTNFFLDFNWKKLNFPELRKSEHIKKYISELKLRTDDEDNVYYLDIVYKVIVRQMGSQIDRNNKDNALIFKTEKKVSNEIKNMINKYISSHQKTLSKERKDMITFNPYTSHLYFKISYIFLRSFLQIYKENSELLNRIDSKENDKIEDDNE